MAPSLPSFRRLLPLPLLLGAAGGVDIRVSKGHFTRDYYSVRVSAIGSGADTCEPPLAYHGQFQQRWQDKTLDSQVFPISPGGSTLNIDGVQMPIKLPAPGAGVSGLFFADPCHSSLGGFGCPNGERFQIKEKLTKIINLLLGSDEFHYWGILGDNFYDTFGKISSEFFAEISNQAKAKPFIAVPGNHDFWQVGSPMNAPGDQYGWGFMQFYGQDTVGGQGGSPFNFAGNANAHQIPTAENFVFGTHIGDTAIFGFSGAHDWATTEPHARGFCEYVGKSAVNTVLVVGHWNTVNLGCQPFMDAPGVWLKMRNMTGCAAKKVLYFDGHEHCNRVTGHDGGDGPEHASGFMVGGTGMYGAGCSEMGFAVVNTDPNGQGGPNVRVDYFKLSQDFGWGHNPKLVQSWFDDIYECFQAHGYAGCRDKYATTMRSVPMPFDCTETKGWESKWTPEQKDYCCKNLNIGCGGCDSKCDFGQPHTCKAKIEWQNFASGFDPKYHDSKTSEICEASHNMVQKQCPGCSQCQVQDMCSAAPTKPPAAPTKPPAAPTKPPAARTQPPAAVVHAHVEDDSGAEHGKAHEHEFHTHHEGGEARDHHQGGEANERRESSKAHGGDHSSAAREDHHESIEPVLVAAKTLMVKYDIGHHSLADVSSGISPLGLSVALSATVLVLVLFVKSRGRRGVRLADGQVGSDLLQSVPQEEPIYDMDGSDQPVRMGH